MIARSLFLAALVCGSDSGALAQRAADTSTLAPPQLDVVDGRVRAELQRFDALLEQGRFQVAIDSARQLLDHHGTQLIPSHAAEDSFKHYVELRQLVHRQLCGLRGEAAAARLIYRRHVDATARELYRTALEQRDAKRLKQVVRHYFSSSWGDNAALMLGEMAFQEADYPAARHYWLHLTSPGAASFHPESHFAQHPDSETRSVDVRVRLILSWIFEGELVRARAALEEFKREYAAATGQLGGQSVSFAQALQQLLQQHADPPDSVVQAWQTFAGADHRNGRAPAIGAVSIQPAWRIPLEPTEPYDRFAADRVGGPAIPVTDAPDRLCSYFPVVSGEHLLIASRDHIHCFDVHTGRAVPWAEPSSGIVYSWRNDPSLVPVPPSRRAFGVPRFTLTADHQKAYAVLGGVASYRMHLDGREPINYLVGIDLAAQGRLLFPSIPAPGPGWAFEGAPVVLDVDLFIGLRENGDVPALHVGCLRAGRLRWRRRLAFGEPIGMGQADLMSYQLLTRLGNTLFVNSNLGVIAALDATDGQIMWVVEYPRLVPASDDPLRPRWQLLRDTNPCVYHKGRLIVAPADCADILALDAATGRLLWRARRADLDIVHLLGTTGNKLIASGRRLWWFELEDGRMTSGLPSNPFPLDLHAAPSGFGRGVLAGAEILWPCRGKSDSIYPISAQTGRMTRQPIDLGAVDVSAGNLLVTPTHLIVAGPDEMVGFRRLDLP